MPQVVLDITEFMANPIRTGIQRVVRELIRHWPDPDNLLLAKFRLGHGLVPLPPSVFPLLLDEDTRARNADPEELADLLAAKLAETPPSLPDRAPVLVPELFYDQTRCGWYRQLIHEQPQKVSFLIYDFIPWLHPNRIGIHTTAPFMSYLRLVREASRTAFISTQTRADFITRIRRNQSECGPVLRLGSDGLGLERQSFSPAKKSWVVVGAINGNKNQDKIFAAFRKLWRDGFDGDLVLIGRVFGADSTEWLQEASKEPRLHHFVDVSDAVVETELSKARATIYVSDIEGFGLPPVESLCAGIPVIVTETIPSVANLAPAGQIRLNSADVSDIASAVQATADDRTAERLWREAASLQLPTWRECARSVFLWMCEAQ